VVYDKNTIEVAPGVFVPGPPLIAEFAVVEGGHEILGMPVAPGESGDAVPRLACRLVKTRGH
jgi:hypothetical protein